MSDLEIERVLESERKTITLKKNHNDTVILDIGGGGEGIIGTLYGRNVISIDRSIDELNDTRNDSIKMVMDACDMKFLSNQFDLITSFFTLMYMDEETKKCVISEAYRVLKPNGIFEIWDSDIPKYSGGKIDIYILQLEIKLPDETINTGYGVSINDSGQDDKSIIETLNEYGFSLITIDKHDNGLFHIECCKRLGVVKQ